MEKHILTEHTTEHTTRPSEPRYPTEAEMIMCKRMEKQQEEALRATCAQYDKERPRYTGICTTLGNPVFSDTPVEPPFYTRPLITYGLQGYQRPIQHPMYKTSSSELGQQPKLGILPEKFFPRDSTFIRSMEAGGNYQDTHFTTEMDGTPLSG
ncbi:hypothetical protein BsWGS_02791 [Bradybaena similaris]